MRQRHAPVTLGNPRFATVDAGPFRITEAWFAPWFRVVDNGEGGGAVDDRLTVLGFEGGAGILTSAQYCATKAWTPGDVNTWAVIDGNIQVNP